MDADLKDRVVIITGASGGIGSAIARQFAAEGAQLVLHCHRHRDSALKLQKELSHVPSIVVSADLTRESGARRLIAQTLRHFGRADTLIANAGSWDTQSAPITEISLKRWRWTLDAVLTSTFLSTREFLRVVKDQRRGNVVLIASTAAVFGEAGHSDYAAAKAAIAFGLLRSVKNEISRIAPHTAEYCGGRVNCICPGWTRVPRNEASLRQPENVRRVTATMALPQIGRPEDMAHAAVFLASDRLARHITGQSVVIAGGMEGRWLWRPEEVDAAIA